MKRILAFVFALGLCACSFAGCGDKQTDPKDESTLSQTEGKTDEKESKPDISVPQNVDEMLVGVWTGSDNTATGTYIFEKGGTGNFVSYTDGGKTVTTIKWGVEGSKLSVSFDGSDIKVQYTYSIGEGQITLTANDVATVYKAGPNPNSGDDVKRAIDPAIVGVWSCNVDGYIMTYTLNEDGSGIMRSGAANKADEMDIRWYVDGQKLFFSIRKMGVELAVEEYTYRLEDGALVIIYKDKYANKYEKVEDGDEESSTEESSTEESSAANLDYPKNGGDDNLAGYWQGTGFDMELEADGTGRRINGDDIFDAFWGVKEGQFYFTFIADGAAYTEAYDYIADGGKLYITDADGIETVLEAK
ncbi:MAG: hypothetical protein IJB65_02785 [Clostridia bacterium]|nr:hypothetical protein [Clostridia bacterium]